MKNITIPALDNHPLATSHFPGTNRCGPVILVSSGAAISRRYYRHFALWLARRGASLVVTWDYRGIGDSWPVSVPGEERKFKYLMSDWARLDYPALIDWIRSSHPDKLIYTIGHSFGGQAFGLSDRNAGVDKSVLIASMSAYWRRMTFPDNYKVLFLLSFLGPVIGRVYGYIPGRFGLGEDMAYDAFAQWSKWCHNTDYFFADPGLPEIRHFAEYKGPVLAIGLDDDTWATAESIDHLVGHFTAADLQRWQLTPADGGAPIGHFGFFKPRFERTLWEPLGEWLFDG